MQFSEAIRLSIGAVRNEPAVWLVRASTGEACGCAIGTGLYSVGQRFVGNGIVACQTQWPWTAASVPGTTLTIAETLSRRHWLGESRESLANWIEHLEVTLDPKGADDARECEDGRIEPAGRATGAAPAAGVLAGALAAEAGL